MASAGTNSSHGHNIATTKRAQHHMAVVDDRRSCVKSVVLRGFVLYKMGPVLGHRTRIGSARVELEC